MTDNLASVKEDGTVSVSDQGIIELVYRELSHMPFEWSNPVSRQEFLKSANLLDHLPFDHQLQDLEARDWFTPSSYTCIDLESYCLERCTSEQQHKRAKMELALVKEIGAEPLFLHLIYLVDHWRSQNRVWGVGRGSSVSCFLLYLIGINKINPLDYDLDHREFFKI